MNIGDVTEQSLSDGATGIDEKPVQRLSCCHEQLVVVLPTKAYVGATLIQMNMRQWGTLVVENTNAIQLAAAHSPTAP